MIMKPVTKIVLGGTCLILGSFDIDVAVTNRVILQDIVQVDETIEDFFRSRHNWEAYGVPELPRDVWESVSE